ncbi:MAG: BMP family ABC transporter substrate-binding protein [Chthoniobacterales bacterium]
MKKLRFIILSLFVLFVSSCKQEATDVPTPPASGAAKAADAKALGVGMVFDIGGRGDKSFNDLASAGLEHAQTELGVRTKLLEPHVASDRETCIQRMAADPDVNLVIGVGFLFTDAIKKLAADFPEKKFACVDMAITPGETLPANVLALKFKEEDGSYLVGVLAATLSKSKKIGFVGGMEIPLIKKFETGFRNGAKAADSNVEVFVKYAGVTGEAFANPAKGKELALSMYDQGADIIFHASGSTGLGVFEATREKKKLAIGVDSDQYSEAPGFILTSMVKNVDTSVFDAIKSAKDGTFKGQILTSGLTHVGGQVENGVDYIHNDKNKALIPDDVHAKVESFRPRIVSGEINTLEGLKP